MAQKHIDSLTGKVFNSEKEYLEHVSPVTGYKPTDPKHHGSRFLRQQKEALRRTGKLTEAREAEIDKDIDEVKSAKVDAKIAKARAKRRNRV